MVSSSHLTPFPFYASFLLRLLLVKSLRLLPLCVHPGSPEFQFSIRGVEPHRLKCSSRHGDGFFVLGISHEKGDKHIHPGWSGVSTVSVFSGQITMLILTMATCSCFKRLSVPLFMLSSPAEWLPWGETILLDLYLPFQHNVWGWGTLPLKQCELWVLCVLFFHSPKRGLEPKGDGDSTRQVRSVIE